jgi:hypothetical protein
MNRRDAGLLAVIGGVLLAHLVALGWLRAHVLRPVNAKAPPSTLLGRVVAPAPPPKIEPPRAAAPTTASVMRPRAGAPSITATRRERAAVIEPQPVPPEIEAGDGSAPSIGSQAGGGGVPSRIDLTLPPQSMPPPGIADRAGQRLALDRPPAAGVSGGAVTLSERQRSDGSREARVVSSYGCYEIRMPNAANTPLALSDLPMHRTALPQRCR